jgi:hypothetical protein
MKPKISLSITRPNGHSSKATLGATQPPTSAMLASADALLEFMSTGVDPHAICASCGVRRDKHNARHIFKEA